MDISNKNICFACAFSALYGGNFIRMLNSLGEKLEKEYACKIYFIFPEQSDKFWLDQLKNKYTVGFTKQTYNLCRNEIIYYIKKWGINLIHSHFEAYDISIAKAVKETRNNVKMVWHLHDYISLDKAGLSFPKLRKFITNQKLWQHYGKYGKNAYFIGVSDEVTNIASHYRLHRFKYPPQNHDRDANNKISYINADVVLNGIDLSRLEKSKKDYRYSKQFVFLTFGGESISKDIPTILEASRILAYQGEKFIVKITNGINTTEIIKKHYPNILPNWIEIVPQTDNIVNLFKDSDCYISASLKETMSMAIAEASIYGLPVIQSDIPGTMWNSDNPSSFVFRMKDPQDLAAKMKYIIHIDKNLLSELCFRTKENNMKRLNLENWCKQIISIYKKI